MRFSLLEEPVESMSMRGRSMFDPIADPGAELCRAIRRVIIEVSSEPASVLFMSNKGRSMLKELSKPL